MLPILRTRLRAISDGNVGLRDILKSMNQGTEILSVEPFNGRLHNTKMTLRIDKGEDIPVSDRYLERVCFYNRIDLAKAIPQGASYPGSSADVAINALNVRYGCDFNEDDLEIVGGTLRAKSTSLGYYSSAPECTNVVDLNWYDNSEGGDTYGLWRCQQFVASLDPTAMLIGQDWHFNNQGHVGSLVYSDNAISSIVYGKSIRVSDTENLTNATAPRIVNNEPEHFNLKYFYIFSHEQAWNDYLGQYDSSATMLSVLQSLLIGSFQSNQNVSVAQYSSVEFANRYPDVVSNENFINSATNSYPNGLSPEGSESSFIVIEVDILYCPNPTCSSSTFRLGNPFTANLPPGSDNFKLSVELSVAGVLTSAVLTPATSSLDYPTVSGMVGAWLSGLPNLPPQAIVGGGGGLGVFQFYNGGVTGAGVEWPLFNPTIGSHVLRIFKTPNAPVGQDLFVNMVQSMGELLTDVQTDLLDNGAIARSCGVCNFPGF